MAAARKAVLGSLAVFEASVSGLVARGADPAKFDNPFPLPDGRRARAKAAVDVEDSNRQMAAFVSGLRKGGIRMAR